MVERSRRAVLGAFLGSVVLPVGAVLLVLSTLRRYRLLPLNTRPIHAPIVAAAVCWALGEAILTFVYYVPSLTPGERESGWFQGLVLVLDFSRFAGMSADRFVLRSVTDEIMLEIQRLSDQEYVDVYASSVRAAQA